MTGGYLAIQVRQLLIPPTAAFRKYIFSDLLSHFGDLDEKADRIGEKYYDDATSGPVDEDCDGDPSVFAEDAHDCALDWYLMMRSLRQTMLNLLAAGLFHLTEQQLAVLSRNAGLLKKPPKDTKLDEVAKWYESSLGLKLKDLSNWPVIDELRLVANTAKHAEGKSSKDLRSTRPQLFNDPLLSDFPDSFGGRDSEFKRPILAPLAGEDLFVSEDLLKQYAEGVEAFFEEIAAYLDAHESEYY